VRQSGGKRRTTKSKKMQVGQGDRGGKREKTQIIARIGKGFLMNAGMRREASLRSSTYLPEEKEELGSKKGLERTIGGCHRKEKKNY